MSPIPYPISYLNLFFPRLVGNKMCMITCNWKAFFQLCKQSKPPQQSQTLRQRGKIPFSSKFLTQNLACGQKIYFMYFKSYPVIVDQTVLNVTIITESGVICT